MELSELLERQRAFFAAGTTRPLKFRMEALERLGTALSDWEDELARALKEYKGSILMVCHEPEFYEGLGAEVWDCTKWTTKV